MGDFEPRAEGEIEALHEGDADAAAEEVTDALLVAVVEPPPIYSVRVRAGRLPVDQ